MLEGYQTLLTRLTSLIRRIDGVFLLQDVEIDLEEILNSPSTIFQNEQVFDNV